MGELTTIQKDSNYVLIQPTRLPPRTELVEIIAYPTPHDYSRVIDLVQTSPLVAVDFETCGNDISDFATHPVGIGIATDIAIVYIGLHNDMYWEWVELLKSLLCHRGLIAHNVQFDGGILELERRRAELNGEALCKQWPWQACTYGLYMQLANEGWTGQRWGLKDAMTEVLLWESTNEEGIDKWLIDNGFVNESGSPNKAEMWRCPPEILGKYCALDADACYLLFTSVLAPVAEKFSELIDYHQGPFLAEVRMLIDAKFDGMAVNVDKLKAHLDDMYHAISSLQEQFYAHPDIIPVVDRWRKREAAKLTETEPAQYCKNGKQSIAWEKWKIKIASILDGTHKKIRFNINSNSQMGWLFYHNLYKTEIIEPPSGNKTGKARIYIGEEDTLDVYLTKAGRIPVGKKVVPRFGEVGQILYENAKLVKEAQYVESYIKLARPGEGGTGHRLYPSCKSPGTVTGRLSGKDPNFQQVPKVGAVLECFVPDAGWVLIDFDVAALEQVVLAELSKDRSLLKLYGNGSNPSQDVYLFNACRMGSLGEHVREYFDPENPTKEQKRAAKEACSKERKISKAITLAKSYGAGVDKIFMTLQMAGMKVPKSEVEEMVAGLDALYADSREYGKWLESQWRSNNGWVLNGIGRPMCVHHMKLKDCTNRVIQSTGHDILMMFLIHLERRLDATGHPWKWYVVDFHDQTIIQTPGQFAKEMLDCFVQALYDTNMELAGDIPIKGEPQIVPNLAAAKLEDYEIDADEERKFLELLGEDDEDE